MLVLGIESSCDETAAAIVSDKKEILSHIIYSQIKEHKKFGGVVPEIAARAHLDKIDFVVHQVIKEAGVSLRNLDAIAGTCGPGLIGGVIVGTTFAKTLSMCANIPFIAINHIEAHALSPRLTNDISFPYLLLLASGGHCQICIVHDINNFEIIGRTLDDSVGESFDKVSKMLGFGYPGGAVIEKNSLNGDCTKFELPRPLCCKKSCDFSFSGLKTAVRIASESCKNEKDKIDLCASFQQAVIDIFEYKLKSALEVCITKSIDITSVVMAGGVAANQAICSALTTACNQYNKKFSSPPIKLCTDNGAMIAWCGIEKLQCNHQTNSLDFSPKPRWPLGC